jgi:hypothetical protein
MSVGANEINDLIREIELAADPETNGLMDREEFPILLRRILVTFRELAAEVEELNRRCALLARDRSVPATRSPQQFATSELDGAQPENRDIKIPEVILSMAADPTLYIG